MSDNTASFEGKVAFVTGAANGIGRATALAFAREGASVVVADVSEQGNQETGPHDRGARRAGARRQVRRDAGRGCEGRAGQDHRGFRAAGLRLQQRRHRTAPAPTADLTEEQWDRIIDVDLRGVFLCMKYEIPLMLKQGGGAIVNTSSGAGVKGIAGQAGVLRREIRRHRPDQGGGPRLRGVRTSASTPSAPGSSRPR